MTGQASSGCGKRREDTKRICGFEIDRLKEENQGLKKAIENFERISGLRISTWPETNRKLAQTVKEVIEGKYAKLDSSMKKIKVSALKIAKFVDDEIQSYEL